MSIILTTDNYKQFKMADVNRQVNPSHVSKLAKAIQAKNLLRLNPIIIDKDFNVIDGQHRLAAAKQLKLQVHYIIDADINENDIANLNSNKSNWGIDDYINFYCSKNNEQYIALRSFITSNPGIGTSTAVVMCTTVTNLVPQLLKDGKYTCDNLDQAYELVALANDFDFVSKYERNFLAALQQCRDSGEYDHTEMLKKVAMKPEALVRCANRQQYCELLEKIFNYRAITFFANFRVTKQQRLRLELAKVREDKAATKRKIRQTAVHYKNREVEGKWAKGFLEDETPLPQAPAIEGNKVPVRIDAKTTIYAKAGSNPDEVRKEFNKKRGISEENVRRASHNKPLK